MIVKKSKHVLSEMRERERENSFMIVEAGNKLKFIIFKMLI